jgi:hypothetical protein
MVFAALLVLASSSSARGDEPVRTRVTIRGTGSDVTIEETRAPARRRGFQRKAVSGDALSEAIRLKTEGVGDGEVLAYLRAHEADLPPIVDVATMTRLRRSGAGKSVAAYLATVAAVDIGETGEGHEAAVSYASAPEAEAGIPVYDVSSGYPFYGGYAAPYPARGRRAAFSHHRGPLPRRQPVFHGAFPSRAISGRRRFE